MGSLRLMRPHRRRGVLRPRNIGMKGDPGARHHSQGLRLGRCRRRSGAQEERREDAFAMLLMALEPGFVRVLSPLADLRFREHAHEGVELIAVYVGGREKLRQPCPRIRHRSSKPMETSACARPNQYESFQM